MKKAGVKESSSKNVLAHFPLKTTYLRGSNEEKKPYRSKCCDGNQGVLRSLRCQGEEGGTDAERVEKNVGKLAQINEKFSGEGRGKGFSCLRERKSIRPRAKNSYENMRERRGGTMGHCNH